MPFIYILIGPPGSGKSTFREQFSSGQDVVILSSDDLIEEYGRAHGMNYSQAFEHLSGTDGLTAIETTLRERLQDAVASKSDILVDRTNMTAKSRRRFLSSVTSDYEKVGVVFDIERSVLDERLELRAAQTGKTIPSKVVDRMLAQYEAPTLEEFDRIDTVHSGISA